MEDRGGNCHPFPLGSAYVLTLKLYKVCGKRSLTHFMGFPTDPTIKTALTGKSMIGELEEKARKKERNNSFLSRVFRTKQ